MHMNNCIKYDQTRVYIFGKMCHVLIACSLMWKIHIQSEKSILDRIKHTCISWGAVQFIY